MQVPDRIGWMMIHAVESWINEQVYRGIECICAGSAFLDGLNVLHPT